MGVKVLLVYPELPPTYWSMRYALPFIGRKATLQYSRGCPHHCEFCDIVELFGHLPRTKPPAQFLGELDLLYEGGWRGSLFVVDDNFIGNRKEVRLLLPALARWQAERNYPFSLFTEASLDLAADEALLDGMVAAGFNMVFVGIETPDATTLEAIGKGHNARSDLLASVRTLQAKGLLTRPRMAAEIIALAVKGHHFFTMTEGLLALERFRDRAEGLDPALGARAAGAART